MWKRHGWEAGAAGWGGAREGLACSGTGTGRCKTLVLKELTCGQNIGRGREEGE